MVRLPNLGPQRLRICRSVAGVGGGGQDKIMYSSMSRKNFQTHTLIKIIPYLNPRHDQVLQLKGGPHLRQERKFFQMFDDREIIGSPNYLSLGLREVINYFDRFFPRGVFRYRLIFLKLC